MKNEFIKRTIVLASVIGLNFVLAFSVSAFALEDNVNNSTNELPKTGPTELFFTTIGLIMVTVAVVYWYRSTRILKQKILLEKASKESFENISDSAVLNQQEIEDSVKKWFYDTM